MRREHPALHEYDNLRFHPADDDNVVCYSKSLADHSDIVVAVVNLDPFSPHESLYHLPIWEWGIAPDEQYRAVDLLSGQHLIWTGSTQWTRLDPHDEPARFFAISRFEHVSYKEPCF
jgi:starch synthase (maltosyl-transferring)